MELQSLLEQKDFSDLTTEEKNFVLSEISMEEYRVRRKLIAEVKLFLQYETEQQKVSSGIKRNVMAVMKAKNQSNSSVLTIRIPLIYSAAASVILLIGAWWFFKYDSKGIQFEFNYTASKPEIIYKTKIVEKEVPKVVEKIEYVTVYKNQSGTTSEKDIEIAHLEQQDADYISNQEPGFTEEVLEQQLKVAGKSSSSQNELKQFLVVGR